MLELVPVACTYVESCPLSTRNLLELPDAPHPMSLAVLLILRSKGDSSTVFIIVAHNEIVRVSVFS
jgi:hypothetical protein